MLQDNVFLHGAHVDARYKVRRENLFIIAINCTTSGSGCFCTKVGGAPEATTGFHIALTELPAGYLFHSNCPVGDQLAATLALDVADEGLCNTASEAIAGSAANRLTNKVSVI